MHCRIKPNKGWLANASSFLLIVIVEITHAHVVPFGLEPGISGKINQVSVFVEKDSLQFFANPENKTDPSLSPNHCLVNLNCMMQAHDILMIELKPEGLGIVYQEPYRVPETAGDRVMPVPAPSLKTAFIATDHIQPAPTFPVYTESILNEHPAITWVNDETLKWLSGSVIKLSSTVRPSPILSSNYYHDLESLHKSLAAIQHTESSTHSIYTIDNDYFHSTAIPTPTPAVAHTEDGIQLSFDTSVVTIAPSPGYSDKKSSSTSQLTYQPRQVPTGTAPTATGSANQGQSLTATIPTASATPAPTAQGAGGKSQWQVATNKRHWASNCNVKLPSAAKSSYSTQYAWLEHGSKRHLVKVQFMEDADPQTIHLNGVMLTSFNLKTNTPVTLTSHQAPVPKTIKSISLTIDGLFTENYVKKKTPVTLSWAQVAKAFKDMCWREQYPVETELRFFLKAGRNVLTVTVFHNYSETALLHPQANVDLISVDPGVRLLTLTNIPDSRGGTELQTFRFDGTQFGIGGVDEKMKMFFESFIVPRLLSPELKEVVSTNLPRGGILHGFPGTGKTLFVKAIEDFLKAMGFMIKVTKISGPEVFSSYVGQSESKVREIFTQLNDPDTIHLILIDEIDSMLPQRGKHSGTGVEDKVVNQFLTMLDGLEPQNNLVVFGTTNRLDLLDSAVTRAGRLELKMRFHLPDRQGRSQILSIHTKTLKMSGMLGDDINLDALVERTTGFTGAELAALVARAKDSALRRAQGLSPDSLHFSPSVIMGLEAIEVKNEDFNWALTQLKPQFGTSQFIDLQGKTFITGGYSQAQVRRLKSVIDSFRGNSQLSTLLILLRGPTGSGKSTLAALAVQYFGAPFCHYVPATSVLRTSPANREAIVTPFESRRNYGDIDFAVVLDDFDFMIKFIDPNIAYDTSIVSTLGVYSRQSIQQETKKLLIIVTASGYQVFLPTLFLQDHVFYTRDKQTNR